MCILAACTKVRGSSLCRMEVTALNSWLSTCSWWADQHTLVSVRSKDSIYRLLPPQGTFCKLMAQPLLLGGDKARGMGCSLMQHRPCGNSVSRSSKTGFILKVRYVGFKLLIVQCLWSCSWYIWDFLIRFLVTLRSWALGHWCDRTKFGEPCVQFSLLCQSGWLL